jgi:uncharacterized cupin superfamily protein
MNTDKPNLYLMRAADIDRVAQSFSHPWNPNSELRGTVLGRALGLKRTGVNLARLPPGKESFVYHSHHTEEEWVYVLKGRGMARIDSIEYEVGPGDFMAFPTPSVPHHMSNPFTEELVYLMGGENHETEVADFPDQRKRMFRHKTGVDITDLDQVMPFGPL